MFLKQLIPLKIMVFSFWVFLVVFKYKKGSDSVLVVHKDDYDQCNTGKPIVKLEDGNSVFKFYRSGPFFFIGGNKSNCANGQKLIVVVLAVRNHPSPPPKAPSPAAPPKGSSHSPAPQGEAPASASSPSSPSPPDEAPAPATGLGPSPNSGSDTPADVNAAGQPPRRSFATPACSTPSVVLVSTVSLVLNVFLGGFIVSL
ncbi:hypothetical protein Pfo_014111 [Paulownia fortunei]|nr:hypothetical protein Pfo_014111 [Paulownia fortunei]